MFGGKLEVKSANVTDELWVFNVARRAWSLRKPAPSPPYALQGHSAHVVELGDGEPAMLTFFGYSPVHGYIDKVQEYDISKRLLTLDAAQGQTRDPRALTFPCFCLLFIYTTPPSLSFPQ